MKISFGLTVCRPAFPNQTSSQIVAFWNKTEQFWLDPLEVLLRISPIERQLKSPGQVVTSVDAPLFLSTLGDRPRLVLAAGFNPIQDGLVALSLTRPLLDDPIAWRNFNSFQCALISVAANVTESTGPTLDSWLRSVWWMCVVAVAASATAKLLHICNK